MARILGVFTPAEPNTAAKNNCVPTQTIACEWFRVTSMDNTFCRVALSQRALFLLAVEHSESLPPAEEHQGAFLGSLLLDFNVKFETLSQSPQKKKVSAIKIHLNSPSSCLEISHSESEVLELWRDHLLKFVNRMGFKEYFRTTMKIGQGSFAAVHLAIGIEQRTKVAIKSYDMTGQARTEDTRRREAVMNEITILRDIDHPNLNRLYGVYEQKGIWHVVLELFQGGQLAYKFQSNIQFSSAHIKIIMSSLLKGLEHLHAKEIYHRDIKPENIMLRSKQPDSEVVIVDFGLSTYVNTRKYLYQRCGTPGFMAPQTFRKNNQKKKLDPVGDIFSLGLVFHILLTGKSLFTARTYEELVNQNSKCEFDLDNAEYGVFTRATVDLLKKMLDTNPFTRITADQALGHPFFTEKDIRRQKRVSTISHLTCLEALFSSHSDESVQDTPGQAPRKYYHSREKQYQPIHRNFQRKNICNKTGVGIKELKEPQNGQPI